MEQYKKQVDQEVKRYRSEVTKMQTSENPYYHDPKVLEYETKQKRAELEKKIDEINKGFTADIDAQIEQMEAVAAKSYFRPSESDRKLVSEFMSDFLADAKLTYTDKEKLDAFERLEQRLAYLDENGLHEVRKQLPVVFDRLGVDTTLTSKLRGMNATLRELKTAEQMQLDELKEGKMNGVDASFRRLRLTHPSYADYKDNRYQQR